MQTWLTWFEQSGIVTPLFESFLLVCIALLVERFVPWPEKYHPLSLFRLVCINLAAKVNPIKKPRAPSQNKLAGLLAIVILLLPSLTIIGILTAFAYYPQFFELLLFLIAIQIQPARRHFKLTGKALREEKKLLARHHLSLIVLRNTQRLSPLGIAKAAVESMILRYNYQVFGSICWFIVTGGLGALAVRLLFEMSQCWNVKLQQNHNFGKFCSYLVTLIFLPSSIIFCILFMLAQGFIRGLNGLSYLKSTSGIIWSNGPLVKAVCGGSLGIRLGGPAYYNGLKQRYPKLGGKREVVYADLKRLNQALFRVLAISLVGLFLSTSLFYLVTVSAGG